MKLYCPECRSTYDDSVAVCPDDGTRLYRLDPADDPLVGAVLDERFRIDWLIGQGGMGAVYRGVQLSVGRKVAIKVLRAEFTDREVALERFFREAKLISGLSHPNIVRLIDFGQDHERDLLYLVMEMVRGTSLSGLLRQGRMRANFALEVAYQVCGALTEPHAEGIVHRDLKPDNLLLVAMSDGTVQTKVLDFGIARALQRNTRLTQTGMICGTPAYMAPEQSRDKEVDERTDLYSLGVILYEMLAGEPPFMGQSSLQIMLKHIQEEPPKLREVLPPGALPEQVESLVYDLMGKNREDRPVSALRVRSRIEELRAELELEPVRLDVERDEEAMFADWLMPAMPTQAQLKTGNTLGLRKETDLFVRTEDDDVSTADTIAEDAATAGVSLDSDEMLGEADPTEQDEEGPTTPRQHQSVDQDESTGDTEQVGVHDIVESRTAGASQQAIEKPGTNLSKAQTGERVGDADTSASTLKAGGETKPGEKRGLSTAALVVIAVSTAAVVASLGGALIYLSAQSDAQVAAAPADAGADAGAEPVEDAPPATVAAEVDPDRQDVRNASSAGEDTGPAADVDSGADTGDDASSRPGAAPADEREPPSSKNAQKTSEKGAASGAGGSKAGTPATDKPERAGEPDDESESSSTSARATSGDDSRADKSKSEPKPESKTQSKTQEQSAHDKPESSSDNVDEKLENIFESGALRAD